MNREIDLLIIKSFENDLLLNEQELLQKMLAEDHLMAERYETLLQIYSTLKNYQPDFKALFSERVRSRLSLQRRLKISQQQLYMLMLRISMSVAAAVFVLLIYVLWQENSITVDGLLGLAGLKSDDFTNLLANY
ncbi:MAG: hypothetical protein CVT92_03805 [Bacteroidetes bacterium HGW-Bacteroidetes-1]|jgi:hypothetical protein|nr:MAG: hypothetical protein CVT92_03805 [Bacteroidetes bacterium HGW-Bacteroidetes-1]